jgi:hypothetical protein
MLRASLLILLALISGSALAGDLGPYTLRIKDHRFIPAQLVVPAKVKFQLFVVNEDDTPEEFESHELNREKIVTGKSKIIVFIGPLKPGTYPYFGDFHQATAQGVLIAR